MSVPLSESVSAVSVGRQVAMALSRAWRADAGVLAESDVEGVAVLLQDAGLSGVIWPALAAPARRGQVGRSFRRAALADAAMSARLDGSLVEVLRALRKAGVEPLVPKGWAVARYYHDPAARPYSDIDLAVHPDQAATARGVLATLGQRAVMVDLHVGLPDLPQRTWNEVFAQTRNELLGDVPVRVLAPEDQFRWLVVHLVRHVINRPRWLLDLAVMLKRTGSTMDWDACLRGGFVWQRWILAVVGLAERLLGACVPDALRERPGCRPPRWLLEGTLWRWGKGHMLSPVMVLNRPAEWLPYFEYRLLNPARWTYRLGLAPAGQVLPVWTASLLARFAQPLLRAWQRAIRERGLRLAFTTHERRTF